MRINLSMVISLIALLIGFVFDKPYIWFPASVFVAGLIVLLTSRWVGSDDVGTAVRTSMLLKLFFSIIGFYALFGQILCIALIIWWFL